MICRMWLSATGWIIPLAETVTMIWDTLIKTLIWLIPGILMGLGQEGFQPVSWGLLIWKVQGFHTIMLIMTMMD